MDKRKYQLISTAVSLSVYLGLILFFLDYASVTRYAVKTKPSQQEIEIDITALDVKQIQDLKPQQPVLEQKVEKLARPKSVKNLFSDINDTSDINELFKDKVVVKTRIKKKKISVDELFDAKAAPKHSTKNIMEKIESVTKNGGASQPIEGVSDAYFDAVHAAVSAGWNPLASQKGMVATMLIKIQTDGTFAFYIKRVNGDREFLEMLKKHMQELQAIGLPKPEKKTTITINFIAKE